MKQGYVIAKNKGIDAFFTSASSYDRPQWVGIDAAKIYSAVELAEAAARKLGKYGAYESRVVSLQEVIELELPDDEMEDLPPQQGKAGTAMVAIVQGNDEQQIHQGDESEGVEAAVDADLGIADVADRQAIDATLDAEEDLDTGEDLGLDDEQVAGGPDGAPIIGLRGRVGEAALNELSTHTLSSYAKKSGLSVAQLRAQADRGDTVSMVKRDKRKTHNVKAIRRIVDRNRVSEDVEQVNELSSTTLRSYANKAHASLKDVSGNKRTNRITQMIKADDRADEQDEIENAAGDRGREDAPRPGYVRESDTMPARPPLDAQPSENSTTAADLKVPPTIKYKDAATTEDKPDTDLTKSGAWAPNAKVKTPANVLSDLRAQITAFEKQAEVANKVDDARGSFCMTVVGALQELLADLEQGTAEGIKAAQIHITSFMNPITMHIPDSVQKFIYMGGRKPTLQDLFDTKRLAQKGL